MDNLVLNQIDFNWVNECEDPRLLKRALKILKDDGGFFPDLEKHISEKLSTLDKKSSKVAQPSNVSAAEKKIYTDDILNWENNIKQTDKVLNNLSDVKR